MIDMPEPRTEHIRDFERQDIQEVARLFVRAFRKDQRPGNEPAPALCGALQDIYFDNPWSDDAIRSKVFIDAEGRLRGFIGVTVQPMAYGDRTLRAAYAGSLTVEEPDRHPLAGARLLRAFLSGPQDISITETANSTALRMWQKLGIPLDAQYSLNWMRIFRPASAGVRVIKRRYAAAAMLGPVARLIDGQIARRKTNPFRLSSQAVPRRLVFQDVTRAAFDEAALQLADLYPLRPVWTPASLDWLSSRAAVKRKFGEPCYRLACDRAGLPVAAYLYFRRRDDFGTLLQSFVRAEQAGDLIDDLFEEAYRFGCAGMRGAAQPWLNTALLSRRTLFLSRTFYLVQARDKTLIEPFRQGIALASGLAGESWMPLIGDDFDA